MATPPRGPSIEDYHYPHFVPQVFYATGTLMKVVLKFKHRKNAEMFVTFCGGQITGRLYARMSSHLKGRGQIEISTFIRNSYN